MIGGNNPPASAAFAMHIDDLFSTANGITTIETDEQEAAVAILLKEIITARKDGDATRAAEKKPHADAAKAVDDEWRTPLRKADIAADELKTRLTPYRAAKEAEKAAAAAKAREEAEAIQKAAQDALRSDDLDVRYAAEAQLKQANKLTAVANKIDRAATGLRTFWTHRIIHRSELLRHIKERYPEDLADALNEIVRQKVAAGVRTMPGVEIIEEKRAA